ncbi:hypothetical protein [Streptomyces sp. NBC_00124]|nr:hypothetical protein [Streptomyces sp. NBC_00124]
MDLGEVEALRADLGDFVAEVFASVGVGGVGDTLRPLVDGLPSLT